MARSSTYFGMEVGSRVPPGSAEAATALQEKATMLIAANRITLTILIVEVPPNCTRRTRAEVKLLLRAPGASDRGPATCLQFTWQRAVRREAESGPTSGVP